MEEEGGFEDTVLEEEVHRIVAQEIEKLPEEQRKVVYFHMEGKNNLEIAEIMHYHSLVGTVIIFFSFFTFLVILLAFLIVL